MINLLDLVGQISVFFFTIVKSILPLCFLIPQDSFDLLKNIIQQSTILSSIPWVNDFLFGFINISSLVFPFIITSLFKTNFKSKKEISFIVFIFFTWLFRQIWFWIILAIFIVFYSFYAVYTKLKGGENYA